MHGCFVARGEKGTPGRRLGRDAPASTPKDGEYIKSSSVNAMVGPFSTCPTSKLESISGHTLSDEAKFQRICLMAPKRQNQLK